MSAKLSWIGHASFRLAGGGSVLYIDPWKLPDAPHDGEVIFVSHEHYDHCSAEDVAAAAAPNATLLASAGAAAAGKLPGVRALNAGDEVDLGALHLRCTAAYNPTKKFHPRNLRGLGLVVSLEGKRIYYAGDTDVIDEMAELGPLDLALLPIGGTYTMNAAEAVEACRRIQPALAVGYHWGDIVGSADDVEAFVRDAPCPTALLRPGETLTL